MIKEEGAHALFNQQEKNDSSKISLRLNPNFYSDNKDNSGNFIFSGFLNFKLKNLDIAIEPRLVGEEASQDLL